MMLVRVLAGLSLTCIAFAADDPWKKVQDLKSGQELRILKRDGKQPILARMDEASDERLVVVIKDQQTAIPRSEIERIDARPVHKPPRFVRESKTTATNPDKVTGPGTRMGGEGAGQSVSSSSSLSIGSKPDFELIYRRPPVAPRATPESGPSK